VPVADLRAEMARSPDRFTAWFARALELALGALPVPAGGR
jgi:hypothetical protein